MFTESLGEPSLGSPQRTPTLTFVERDGETTMKMTIGCRRPSVDMWNGRLHASLEKGAVEMRDRLTEFLGGNR